MTMGLIGKKCGMTRVFTPNGDAIAVTVVAVEPNKVTQLKTVETDGYRAIQVSEGGARRANKPLAGHYAKASVKPGRSLREFRLGESEGADLQAGAELTVAMFKQGQYVDVTGVTIGKGYAGSIKRHHFTMGDATHGNSLSHRHPGSIGQRQSPGRVFPGKKMAGHLGNTRRTTQSLEVIRVDAERNVLLIKGAVPGAKGGRVIVRPAVKLGG